jgi:hypothetical protein
VVPYPGVGGTKRIGSDRGPMGGAGKPQTAAKGLCLGVPSHSRQSWPRKAMAFTCASWQRIPRSSSLTETLLLQHRLGTRADWAARLSGDRVDDEPRSPIRSAHSCLTRV